MRNNKTKYRTKAKVKTDSSIFQNEDVNSKCIFQNPVLCAQFLRNYSGLPQFQNVQPEDVEKVSLRYHIFDEVELNSDTVVRIRQNPETDELPIYIVPLIDHKSSVDHNVSMQLLLYMVCIWKDWEKEMKNKYGLNCHNKDFRYPFILPLVYYEGKGTWTADLHLHSRLPDMGDALKKYIPDFSYQVVRIRDYPNQALLEKGDGMSLLMILNKVQEADDFRELYNINSDKVDSILADTPQSAIDVIAKITQSLCRRLNVPEKESDAYVSKIRSEKKMGYLFENMEKMDIQWERQQRAYAEKKLQDVLADIEAAKTDAKNARTDAENARADAENARTDAENARTDAENARTDAENARTDAENAKKQMLKSYIELLQEFVSNRDEAKKRIIKEYSLDDPAAEKALALYWK